MVAHIDLSSAATGSSSAGSDQTLAAARDLVGDLEVQRVIIAPQSPGGADMLEVMRAFGEIGVRMSVIPKLTSRGPIFFRQERVGREGRRFRMLKFRSMVHDAEARKGELHRRNQAAEGFFKIADDRGSHGSGAWRARPTSTNSPSC